MLGIRRKCSADYQNFWVGGGGGVALENSKKSPLKHFSKTPTFAQFQEFVYNVFSKIVY